MYSSFRADHSSQFRFWRLACNQQGNRLSLDRQSCISFITRRCLLRNTHACLFLLLLIVYSSKSNLHLAINLEIYDLIILKPPIIVYIMLIYTYKCILSIHFPSLDALSNLYIGNGWYSYTHSSTVCIQSLIYIRVMDTGQYKSNNTSEVRMYSQVLIV